MTVRRLQPADTPAVRDMLVASGAFNDTEVRVAIDMVEAGLTGDYVLPAVELDGILRGYACIGQAALTLSSWYLYWICVHPDAQGRGAGRLLQAHIEELVRQAGGTRLVLETSGRSDYERTRRFYRHAGFLEAGRIPDFYKPGDDCVIYCKVLA